MATDVVMPQMGESIFEGTITKWLKKAGDPVQKDEPLFEISTDKVDAEIPSPVTGILQDIMVPEGETVQINTVVAIVVEEGQAAKTPRPSKSAARDGQTKQSRPEAAPPAASQQSPETPTGNVTASQALQAGPGRIDVVMPQMGESIFEGTITKWLKRAGDAVQKD